VVDPEQLQLSATSKKVDELETRPKDNRGIAAQLGVGHHAVQEVMDILGHRKVFPLGYAFAYGYIGTQEGWKVLLHPLYSPDLVPSDYHLFGPLKDHLKVTTEGLTKQSRKPCEASCE
jgi:hypothetical protein